jgi:hypothetical protein
VDGNVTDVNVNNDSDYSDNDSSEDDDQSIYDTDDEIDPEPISANFVPIPGQTVTAGQPLQFDVKLTEDAQSSSLPLCLMMNCRSVCNKI